MTPGRRSAGRWAAAASRRSSSSATSTRSAWRSPFSPRLPWAASSLVRGWPRSRSSPPARPPARCRPPARRALPAPPARRHQVRLVAQQLGLVVHPTRSLDTVLESTAAWAHAHGANVGQVRIPGLTRQVADPVDPADCEILLSLGGDGTALHALRAGAPAKRPVLGIACGSVGVLTSVTGDHVAWALDQFAEG